tara:strand:+ start:1691 stop:2650 length:960 start_codon:yes stop_codon:yes gene_type:complete
MSGSSAIASARRRRAEPTATTPDPQTIKSSPVPTSNVSSDNNIPKRSMKPLEILKIHDLKIQDLENSIDEKIIELSKVVVHENIKHIVREIEAIKLNNNSLRDKLNASNQHEKSYIPIENGGPLEKIIALKNNQDELKTLVIKSQQQSIDTHTEMIKMKCREAFMETRINKLETIIGIRNENNNEDDNEDGEYNKFNTEHPGGIETLLRNMMQSSITENEDGRGLNIHNNDSSDQSELYDIGVIKLADANLDLSKREFDTSIHDGLINISDHEDDVENIGRVVSAVKPIKNDTANAWDNPLPKNARLPRRAPVHIELDK